MSEQQQQPPPPPHTSSQYNAQVIIDNATTQLNNSSTGGVQSAQTTFQSALLDWVDDVTMGDTMETEEAQRVRSEIVKLWLAYAHFNKNSKLVSIRLVHAYG